MSCYHLVSSHFFQACNPKFKNLDSLTRTWGSLNRPTTAAFPPRRTTRSLPKLTSTLHGHKCQVWPEDGACVVEQLFVQQLVQINSTKKTSTSAVLALCEVNVSGDWWIPLIKATRLVVSWGGVGDGGSTCSSKLDNTFLPTRPVCWHVCVCLSS